jgi:opacity protein-like surface antigen
MTKTWLVFLGILMLAPLATSAQVAPAQSGGSISMTLGAGFSGWKTDFAIDQMYGIAAYYDLDIGRWAGLEVEGRTIQFNSVKNIRQDTISAGGRFLFPHYHHLHPYAKFLGGIGSVDFPPPATAPYYGHDTFAFYAIGGGVDYRLTRHFSIRGEYESQFWPSFPNNGLTPRGFTIGAGYRFF